MGAVKTLGSTLVYKNLEQLRCVSAPGKKEGGLPYKEDWVIVLPFGIKKAGYVPLVVLSL